MNNLHVYPTSLTHESRINKETETLFKRTKINRILVVGVWKEGLEQYEKTEFYELYRIKLSSSKFKRNLITKSLSSFEWILRVFLLFKDKNIDVIQCHSISSLPLGILFKLLRGASVVYDAHELETEKHGWNKLAKGIGKIFECFAMLFVDSMLVVSQSIMDWYSIRYPRKKIYLVRNAPVRKAGAIVESDILKTKFKISENEVLFIYQGMLSEARNVGLLLNVFCKVKTGNHIVFMGFGDLEDRVIECSKEYSNIHFHEAVKQNEVLKYTASADIGFSILDNSCLNHYYCLPNKLFEYIVSGLPVIVSNFPDMAKMVSELKCGWESIPQENELVELINKISKKDVDTMKNSLKIVGNKVGWYNEESKLLSAYTDAGAVCDNNY